MKYSITVEVDIPENATIHQAENIAFQKTQELGKNILLTFISNKKQEVEKTSSFRLKDTSQRHLETKFGLITFEKKKFRDNQNKKTVTPIINALGLTPRQAITNGLKRAGVELAIEKSYGYAKTKLEENHQLIRSKTAIWKDVQKIGQQIIEKQNEEVNNLFTTGEVNSECADQHKIVALELDETMINARDAKDSEKHVPRLAIIYTSKKQEGKKRYILQNKRFIAQIENPEEFGKRVFLESSKHYNHQQSKQVVFRSDGARWIQNLREEHFSNALWQTDPFHVIEKIKNLKLSATTENHWIEHIQKAKPHLLQKDIFGFLRGTKNEDVQRFSSYIDRNLDGLKILPQLKDKSIPWVDRKMFVRGSGAAERNIGLAIVDRMKNQRMWWSKTGANNLLALRCLKFAKKDWNSLWLNIN
jgi:hypothetical protein